MKEKQYILLRQEAVRLRRLGKTYQEIQKMIKARVPPSTLSYWLKGLPLNSDAKQRIGDLTKANMLQAQKKSVEVNSKKRSQRIKTLRDENADLTLVIQNKRVAKIALSLLYIAEGTKSSRGAVTFGNSDPHIIRLFLHLLRKCYNIEERKFRCTVQCRADQNTKQLESFWSGITKIPRQQFYRTQMDPRTKGKPTQKQQYKGVCRIDYFSAGTYNEIIQIGQLLYEGI